MQYHRYFTVLFVLFCLVKVVFAEDLSIHQTNLNLIDRIARLEEGQKAIVIEMRTRFKAIDKRFELIDKRFETMESNWNKRFETMENNWNKRFESLTREMNHRFEAIEKRFDSFEKRLDSFEKHLDSLDNRIAEQGTFLFTMLSAFLAAIISLIAFVIWDRKTIIDKFSQQTEIVDKQINEDYKIPINMQNKIRDVYNYINQNPEIRPILNAA